MVDKSIINYVRFGMQSSELLPNMITEELEIQPTRSYARGDEYVTHTSKTEKGVRKRESGVWQVSSKGTVQTDNLQDHIGYIIDLLHPKQAEIRTILSNPEVYVDVCIWVESDEPVHSIMLPSKSVSLLAALCRDINISVISRGGISTDK